MAMEPLVVEPGVKRKRVGIKDIDFTVVIVLALVAVMLVLFLLYPISRMLLASFVMRDKPITWDNLTLYNFSRFFTSRLYVDAMKHSLAVSLSSVFFAVLLGLPLAFIVSRIDIPGKSIISSLATLPLILPPFVGAYSWILLLGRNGFITFWVKKLFGVTLPSIYGFHGITIATSLSYYPFVFLMTQGALALADPYLEESADVMGAGFLRKLRTITLPLVAPSIGAAAITVFMRAIGNFGVPSILGGEYYVLPTLIFFQIVGYYNINAASAISLVSVLFSVMALLIMRYFTARQSAVTLTTTTRQVKQITHPVAKILGMTYVVLLLTMSLAPHITVLVAAFSEVWAGTPWPAKMGLGNFRRIYTHAMNPLRNSLVLSISATVISLVMGSLVAYTAVRRKFRGRWLIDMLVMLPFVLPGIVVGVALLSSFGAPPFYLAGTAYILIIAYVIRRMPYVFRSASGALQGMDPVLEQASGIMGAKWITTFSKITFPLIAPSVTAAGLLTFTTLIGELSTTMMLYSARWKTATVTIYEYLLEDMLGPACAMGTVINVIVLVGVFSATKLLGEKMSNMFGGAG
ncbi:MAG: iron ABC transporter permease [Firmicutes bacterium]|nr:iron ABC transporter permease [Bacillota bacterium]